MVTSSYDDYLIKAGTAMIHTDILKLCSMGDLKILPLWISLGIALI